MTEVWTRRQPGGGADVAPVIPFRRVTLSSGSALTTTDIAGAPKIYSTPAGNQWLSTYDGSSWVPRSVSEITLTLDSNSSHVGYHASGSIFYLFHAYDSAARVTRLVSGPAWTSATSPGLGPGTTELELFQGRWVNKYDMAARWGNGTDDAITVLARQGDMASWFQTTADGQATDSEAFRLLGNLYLPAERRLFKQVALANWSNNTATWKAAGNNDPTSAVSVLVGMPGVMIEATYSTIAQASSGGVQGSIALSINGTSPDSRERLFNTTGANYYCPVQISKTMAPGLGVTKLTMLEFGSASGLGFYGGNAYTWLDGSVVM